MQRFGELPVSTPLNAFSRSLKFVISPIMYFTFFISDPFLMSKTNFFALISIHLTLKYPKMKYVVLPNYKEPTNINKMRELGMEILNGSQITQCSYFSEESTQFAFTSSFKRNTQHFIIGIIS
jgi:hypothetical protein